MLTKIKEFAYIQKKFTKTSPIFFSWGGGGARRASPGSAFGKHSCTYRILYNQKQGMGRIRKDGEDSTRIQSDSKTTQSKQQSKAREEEDSTSTHSKGWGGFNNNSKQGVGRIQQQLKARGGEDSTTTCTLVLTCLSWWTRESFKWFALPQLTFIYIWYQELSVIRKGFFVKRVRKLNRIKININHMNVASSFCCHTLLETFQYRYQAHIDFCFRRNHPTQISISFHQSINYPSILCGHFCLSNNKPYKVTRSM